ncbi:MAG: hypothetical protein EZS28_050560, partial [Streblomastix strix]
MADPQGSAAQRSTQSQRPIWQSQNKGVMQEFPKEMDYNNLRLINIFEHRDLKLVTRSQTVAFANLTAPYSKDIFIFLFEKQPYPCLMILFDHQIQLTVDNAVASVFNIVCGGSSSVFETETSVDKQSKDRSALALGKMYRMKEIENA